MAGDKATVNIIGLAEAPSAGIHRGMVNSIDDVVSSISACHEKLERMIGAPVSNFWVGISGPQLLSQTSRGFVSIARPDGEIQEEDVDRAVEAAKTVATPANYEILHTISKSFTVDRQAGIKSPVGMTGVRLEVDAEIIQAPSAQIRNLTRAIYRPGLEIDDLVYSILATAETVATERQKKLGTVVVNIGSATTSLAVFEEGDILHTAVLPLGSDSVTADLAVGLRISADVAEEVKFMFGTALPTSIQKNEEINLRSAGGQDDEMVMRRHVAEIIEARVEEIFEKIDKELRRIDRSGLLPGGVILTGGGAKLPGMVELARKTLRLPAQLGYPSGILTVTEAVNDLTLTTAIGLVLWGFKIMNASSKERRGIFSKVSGLGSLAKNLGKFLGGFRS